MSNQTPFSDCRDPKCRSKKSCCCGGHNAGNAKANKRHNGTASRLRQRLGRQKKATAQAQDAQHVDKTPLDDNRR